MLAFKKLKINLLFLVLSILFLGCSFSDKEVSSVDIQTILNKKDQENFLFIKENQIYLADQTGENIFNVSKNNKKNLAPFWLEKNKKILFISQNSENFFEIWQKDLLNEEIDLLWGSKKNPDFISLSPDRLWFIYGEEDGCFLFDIEEKEARRFADSCKEASWDKQGRRFIYIQDDILYIMEFNIKKQTSDPKIVLQGLVKSPIFINNKDLVFESDGNIEIEQNEANEEIEEGQDKIYGLYKFSLEDNSLKNLSDLSFSTDEECSLQLSPDENKVLYERFNSESSFFEIWLVNLDGKNLAKLVLNDVHDTLWSFSETLYYSLKQLDKNEQIKTSIYKATKDGLNKEEVISEGEIPIFFFNIKPHFFSI